MELEAAVTAFVRRLASKSPLAVQAIKHVVNVHQELGLAEGRRYERRVIDTLRETADHEENRRAFIEDGGGNEKDADAGMPAESQGYPGVASVPVVPASSIGTASKNGYSESVPRS